MSKEVEYTYPDPQDQSNMWDEYNTPTIMTFRQVLSESESEEEENDENAVAENQAVQGDDVDIELIQALESKVLIKKVRGKVPLSQYNSPNRSPKKKSPKKSPLPTN